MINRIGLQYSSPLPEPLPACYQIKNDDKKGELCLLCLTPLIDATTSDAMSQIRTISIALKGLALTLKHISFTAADNTSVNPCIARKIKKPMIRCKSHVIALSIKEFLNGHKGKWFKVSNLVFKESYLDLIDRVSAYTSPCLDSTNMYAQRQRTTLYGLHPPSVKSYERSIWLLYYNYYRGSCGDPAEILNTASNGRRGRGV